MFYSFLKKLSGAYVAIRYRNLSPDIRYYYRDTWYCKINQLKYFSKDYLKKKPYKDIVYRGEFAPEIEFVLPHAYWHYKNGTLRSTASSHYTRELYFFSPSHSDNSDERTPEGNYNFEMPRVLYSQDYDNIEKWLPVPYKEQYKNDIYVYDKPLLIIANRYNSEWDGPPISFYSKELLTYMFNRLKDDYTIVYNRPGAGDIILDNSEVYDLNEIDWIRENYPEVILMKDLQAENKGNANNFNHLQLMVYSNADNFISIHGGTSAFASCFGGQNLILSKKGPEHHFKCFEKLFPKLSGAKTYHAKTDDDVKAYVDKYFVKKI